MALTGNGRRFQSRRGCREYYFLRLLAALCAQNGEASCKQRESANGETRINFWSLVSFWVVILIVIVPRMGISKSAHSKS